MSQNIVHNRNRIPSLDGLRAFSIAMVMIGHGAGTLKHLPGSFLILPFFGNAHTGVSCFFVISGLLITKLLVAEKERSGRVDLKAFYIRRAFRLLPALVFYLSALFILDLLGVLSISVSSLLIALFFASNYFGSGNWFVGHTWSLSIEEQFYLLWPYVLSTISRRTSVIVALSIIVFSPILRVASYVLVPSYRGRIPIMTHTRADMLMFGCLIALTEDLPGFSALMRQLDRSFSHVFAFLILMIVDPLLAMRFKGAYMLSFGYSIEGLCISVIILRVIRMPARGAGIILNMPAVVAIGTISYSLYLWQQLFLTPLNTTVTGGFPVNFLCSFAIAVLSFFVIERPAQAFRTRFINS